MENMLLQSSIKKIKGVGEARAILLNKLGIYTIEDVITYYPREYEDRSKLKLINELNDGENCSFEGAISGRVVETRLRKNLTIQKVNITDHTGKLTAIWFNQSFVKRILKPEAKYIFYGNIAKKYNKTEVQNPIYEKVEGCEPKKTCRIVPVYSLTAKLTQTIIRDVIENALELVSGNVTEVLPKEVIEKYNLVDKDFSLKNIHFPNNYEDFQKARYRLVFEELFMLQLKLLKIKHSYQEQKKGVKFKKVEEIKDFINGLPFKLTESQLKAFSDIEKDMDSDKIMNRLIQGDVGSGKTIVAVLSMLKAVKCGYQAAMMVPTEILAQQHFSTIRELLLNYDIKIEMLIGSISKAGKSEITDRINDGSVDIVIGTHALLEDGVCFNRLGLVVTDEQHRFGVRQRSILSNKDSNPDVLVMSATPIPRTLALILYGDLDISIIDQLPPGRKQVKTYVVDNSMRERINKFLRKIIFEGHQVFIVCPLVEESDEIDARSAQDTADILARNVFCDLRVGLIHGKMKSKDKDIVMQGFVKGNIDILVSTTVIEVGVDVPNATVMVVENAERFGLAQLHQLRGRVGRGDAQAYCILFNEAKSSIAIERMKVMQETNDGFIISEKDLELRGPGDFFGTRQHGLPDLKIANLYKDMEILKVAQEAALAYF